MKYSEHFAHQHAMGKSTWHVEWCTKYRYKLFKSEYHKNICVIALDEAAKKANVVLLEREVEPEHVHLVIELPLTVAPTDAVGKLKSFSAKIIFALIPNLRLRYPKGHLWSTGKFVISVGNITLEKAKEYVRNQKAHHAKHTTKGILARAAARVSPAGLRACPKEEVNIPANPDVTLNHPYVFSTNKAVKDDAEKLSTFARKNLNAQTAALIYYATPIGKDYGKYIAESFTHSGGTVVASQDVPLEAVDFRTELLKLKTQNPNVIYAIQLSSALGNLIKQARELGINTTIMSFSEAEDPGVLSSAGTAAEGLIVSSAESPTKSLSAQQFQERYKQRFGTPPDVLAANAYDSFMLEMNAYNTCGKNSECMRTALHSVANYLGVSGEITINPDGASFKPNMFKIVKNGTFVPYTP